VRRYYLDLFSGIGGFALGAYREGVRFDEHYFSEIDKYAISVYQKRFPDAIPLGDIKKIKGDRLPKGQWIISGGFPCQDISVAGKGAGLDGDRSGLWFEYARLISEIRPCFALMENVGALTVRGLDRVLGSLAEIGYDAVWQDIRASDVGAPHRRERIWIVAYPSDWNANGKREQAEPGFCGGENPNAGGIRCDVAHPGREGIYESGIAGNACRLRGLERGIYADGLQGGKQEKREYLADTPEQHGAVNGQETPITGRGGTPVADTACQRRGKGQPEPEQIPSRSGENMADSEQQGLEGHRADTGETTFSEFGNGGTQLSNAGNNGVIEWERELRGSKQAVRTGENIRGGAPLNAFREWWAVEPDVGRVANGVPFRVDRLKCLGNSVVPEIPAMMWLQIKEYL
jgi:DNA (cytosine-5)-methyltransferase 1